MANPNIVNVSTLNGNTVGALVTTSLASLVSNAASSATVYKIENVVISNITASAATVSVGWNNAAAAGGTTYWMANNVSVPASSTLIVTDKSTGIYLTENTSLVVIGGTANALHAVVSYEQIS
jgi:hypothetical protein